MSIKIKKILISLLILKALLACLAAFGYFTHPHVIRQVDTMGISLRYAMKFQDGFELRDLLPTTLASEDLKYEVTPMEFPLLNLITSLPFLINSNYSYAFAHLFLLLLNALLFIFTYKKWRTIDTKLADAWLLIPLFGITYVYFIRFMPDAFAFLLISYALPDLWNDQKKLRASGWAALALLIKPPVFIVYALLLLKPFRYWFKVLPFLILSLVPAVLYYTVAMDELRSISDLPPYFAVEIRSPIISIIEFFAKPKEIWVLFTKELMSRYSLGIVIASIVLNYKEFKASDLTIFAVLLFQVLIIAALGSTHIFVHSYYCIGTSFICCMALNKFTHYKKINFSLAVVILLLVINVETGLSQAKTVFRPNLKKECLEIINNVSDLSKETHIRNEYSQIPEIGMCMMKISNSAVARFGVYRLAENIDCPNIVFKTNSLKICDFSEKI